MRSWLKEGLLYYFKIIGILHRMKEFHEINDKKIQEGTSWTEIIVFQSCNELINQINKTKAGQSSTRGMQIPKASL